MVNTLLGKTQSYLKTLLNGKGETSKSRRIIVQKNTKQDFALISVEVGKKKDCHNIFTLSTSRKVPKIYTPIEK